MIILGMFFIAIVIIGVMAWMSDEEPKPKKPWKPKIVHSKKRNSTTYPGYTSYS